MGFHLFWGEAVVLGDLAVYAKEHRFLLDGEVGATDLALDRLYSYARNIGYLGHVHILPSVLLEAITHTAQVVSELLTHPSAWKGSSKKFAQFADLGRN